MRDLVVVLVAGFAASLIDGALGMGFGPTSSSILLGGGLAPAAVSGTVNVAKVVTGFASALAHWRFRNIDHRLVVRLAVPGAAGALVGVAILSVVDPAHLRPALAALLVVAGARILLRFSTATRVDPSEFDDLEHDPDRMPRFDDRGVGPVAALGGVTNGLVGAWGPIVTPFLVHRDLPPRFAVGSVNTAEVAVAAASTVALATSLGTGGLDPAVVAAMLLGGVAGAPVAAWAARRVPARPMGLAVGGLLLAVNARELAGWAGLGAGRWIAYGAVAMAVVGAAARPRLPVRPVVGA